jgi:hypothetical protein
MALILLIIVVYLLFWVDLLSKKMQKIGKKTNEIFKNNVIQEAHIMALETREKNRNQQINLMDKRIKDLHNSFENLSLNVPDLLETPPTIYPDNSLEKIPDFLCENTPIINDQELLPIYQKIQQIDKKLKELEIANQRIIVTGGKSNPQPKPLPIDKDELINIYNYAPQILAEYATPVSVTAESYRKKTGKTIYLEHTINGYYWVILTQDEKEQNYWLLPNGNKNIRFYRLKEQIRLLFTLKGSKQFRTNILTMTKLSRLKIEPSGLLWQLVEKGCIENKRSEITNLKKTIQQDLEDNLTHFVNNLTEDFNITINNHLAKLSTNNITIKTN